jgi:hypothetical protein
MVTGSRRTRRHTPGPVAAGLRGALPRLHREFASAAVGAGAAAPMCAWSAMPLMRA